VKLIFLSDAHLKGLDDPNQRLLCSFLEGLDGVDTLVILGDLFDFWVGFNDAVYYQYLPILAQFLRLKDKGVKIKYLEGNHDFFMGPFFTDVLKAEVYPYPMEMELDGKRLFLAHGDTVNKRDYGYRFLRWFLRRRPIHFIMRNLPSLVWRMAKVMSKGSRQYLGKGFDYDTILLNYAMDKRGYDAVILGHSHVPRFERIMGGMLYVNLGDWITHYTYLVYEDGGFRLERCSPGT